MYDQLSKKERISSMYHCTGYFSRLEELNSENDSSLFSFLKENSEEYKQFVSDQELPATYLEFIDVLKKWFSNGRLYQFLVYKKIGVNPVGTIFFYHLDIQKESIKISAFFDKESRKHLLVAESLMMSIAFARNIIGIEEILFSVYENNKVMKKIAKKLLVIREDITHSLVNKERKVEVYKMPCSISDNILAKLAILHR